MKNLTALFLVFGLCTFPAAALEFRVGVERGEDTIFRYEIGVIKLALEKAGGEHTLVVTDAGDANQTRMVEQLAAGTADFDVMFTGINQERFDKLLTVPIPMQRGLLGHRIMIVSDESAGKMASIKTIEDLKGIKIGSGTGWPDTDILRQAGLTVEDSKYDNLFKMVAAGRIDGFARGAAEPFLEVGSRKEEFPNLAVDSEVLIVYPFDMFLFLNKNDAERHDILLSGLQKAYEDGSFMAYFENHPQIKEVFEQAGLDDRVRFEIDNPLLPAEIAAIPDQYWHGR